MFNNNLNNSHDISDCQKQEKVSIIKTDLNAKDGQTKCPKCGATDILTNVNTGKLRCNFCRHEFEPQKLNNMIDDISKLNGQVIGSGASEIIQDTKNVLTFKCSSCGAEVVIDITSATNARCHWCRNILSVNQQIPNGTIPDVLLPFKVKKEEAMLVIEKFVRKRKFFANPKFKMEFTTENIMGVYFPYMIIDVNSHVKLSGYGEQQTRKYIRGSGNNAKTYYDADLYEVEREFDLIINGLTIESSSDKLNNKSHDKTNNVINAIMPFDIENCVKYDSNYLRGYSSEKRDTNIEQLKNIVNIQSQDIARISCNQTLKQYDRGVTWQNEDFILKGQQWKAAYLPVWLYSYQEIKGNHKVLHYVAVNARTKEVMGSIPIYMPKLIGVSSLIEVLGIIIAMYIDFEYNWIFLFLGIIYFIYIYIKYRNSNARHTYETETKNSISNLKNVDRFIKHETGMTNPQINGVNNNNIKGQSNESKLLNLVNNNPISNIIEDINKKGEK